MTEVNGRTHRETRRIPAELLAEERLRLHPVPEQPFTAAFGETRRVGKDSTISVESDRYSVPHQLVDERVWFRLHGDELIATARPAAPRSTSASGEINCPRAEAHQNSLATPVRSGTP
ncbi:hypothetical protein SUDANB120_00055 [Streptomyces sp. enrichment culture]